MLEILAQVGVFMKNFALSSAAALLVCAALAASDTASAETIGWSGYYLGADVGVQGGRSGDLITTLTPARDNQFVYIEAPQTRNFDQERSLSRKIFAGVRAGHLFDHRSFVWGVELQANAARLEQRFTVGPIDAGPIRTNTVLLDGSRPGTVNNSNDTLKADFKVDAVASLRARIGVPIGDRTLVSAFGGPSFVKTSLRARQDSSITIQICTNPSRPTLCALEGRDVSSQSLYEDKIVAGAVVGAALDFRLTDRWSIHGETSLSRFQSVEAYAGNSSKIGYEPELYSAGFGATYRF
ncbi:outer membrane beta-barrel protein [Pseudomonas sp. ODNR1LW]|nr:outer membrane beta-barrel protein [Pseudomonas sp. ODNR1LW]